MERQNTPIVLWPMPGGGCGWFDSRPRVRVDFEQRCTRPAAYELVSEDTLKYGDEYLVCVEHAARARTEPAVLRWMLSMRTMRAR